MQNYLSGSSTKAAEVNFAGQVTAAKVQGRSPIGTGISSSGSNTETTYRVGDPARPNIRHDNGFLQNPNDRTDPVPRPTIPPTQADRDYYNEQKSNVAWAQRLIGLGFDANSELPGWLPDGIEQAFNNNKHFLDSPDGIDAYRHFLEGNGRDRQFSYADYINDDASGRTTLNNATRDLQRGVEDIYDQIISDDPQLADRPFTFKVTGGQITAGASADFPYPATDNWQKAIGGHSIWSSGTVTVTPPTTPGGKPQFSMRMTLHAEDRYNFNPGQADIETGAPDSLRGRLEMTGLGHQYMNYAEYRQDVSWSQGNITRAGGTTTRPVR